VEASVKQRAAGSDDEIVIPGRYVEWFGWALNAAAPLGVLGIVALLMGLAGRPGWLVAGIFLLALCAVALGVCAWSFTRPARLTLRREGFSLLTPAYVLEADWDNVAAIGVEEGPPKPGLLILFEDVEAVLRTAKPRRRGKGGFSVPALRADVQANFVAGGYHLQVPGNLLRWDADRIAHWMAQARSGEPWEETA
jgi:hypothetical protein